MHVGFLGPLLVRVDGRDVTPAGQRLRDVFTVLLQRRGRPVPPEIVLDLVWGQRAGELSGAAVHTVVARLRRLLGADAIRTRDIGYLVEGSTTTDEEAFAELVRRASRLGDLGDTPAAAATYRDALSQWRGETAFDGVSDQLVTADRVRLGNLRSSAVEDLVTALLDRPDAGEPGEAYRLAVELSAARPLQERPCQLAMVAAYRGHRQADSLQLYRQLRERLSTELGIEPSLATQHLHSMILRQDPTLLARNGPPQGTSTAIRVDATRPPTPVSSMIGRESELAMLLQALAAGRRLLTLVGPAGVGKSRLLLEVAARSDSGRVVYVDMSGLDGIGADELAEVLALEHGVNSARQAPLEALARAFAQGRWLLFIDEADWVGDAVAALVATMLGRCPGVQAVVTSRHPLDVQGEALFPVEPLGCPEPGAGVPATMSAPAVRLLIARLTDRAVRVGTDSASVTMLGEIARLVDGVPLAVELVAGQATGRSLAELTTLARTPLDVPAATRRPRADRHRTLRDALVRSVDQLDRAHLQVLRRLGVFVGRFDLEAAGTVVGGVRTGSPGPVEVRGMVRELARHSLIQVDRRGPDALGFRLLRPVRELALEGLDADELATAQALHRRWYADRWRGHRRRDDLIEDVREHLDDYVEALRSAVAAGDSPATADLTGTLTELWKFAGARGPGLRWTSRTLERDYLVPADRARVQTHRAVLALRHRSGLVLSDTAAAIPVLESIPDLPFLVDAHLVRALELLAAGEVQPSLAHVGRAVSVARGSPAGGLAVALSVESFVTATSGDPATATPVIDEALVCFEASESTAERITLCGNIAVALLSLDRPRDALDLLDRVAPETKRVLAAPPDFFLMDIGWAALGCGEPVRAAAAFGAAVGAGPPPVDRQTAETLLGMSCALAALGHPFAAGGLSGALELSAAVGLTLTAFLRRSVGVARQRAGGGAFAQAPGETTDNYCARLAGTLRQAAESVPGT